MFFAFCYFAQLFHAFNGQFNIVYWKDPPRKSYDYQRATHSTRLGQLSIKHLVSLEGQVWF